jgi:tol-pal system protein YbgF
MLKPRNRRCGECPQGSFSARLTGMIALILLLLATGCASRKQLYVVQADTQCIRADMDSLKRDQRASRETLTALETEMRAMKANSEYGSSSMQEKIEGLAARLDELVTRMDRTLAPLEEYLRRQASADTTQSETMGVDYYDAAMRDLSLGNYDLAEVGFLQFLENYPKSDLADDARYSLGETYYARKRYEEAVEEYQRVVTMDTKGGKTPAAMLKLGLCYHAMQRPKDARTTWEDLIKKFPFSEEAKVAEQRLAELKDRN